jgi:hypothetical protein
MNHRISKNALKDGIRTVGGSGYPSRCICPVSILAGTEDKQRCPSLHDYFDSKEEAVRHYEILKKSYQSISPKRFILLMCIPWESAELTRSEIVLKMAYITWMTNTLH